MPVAVLLTTWAMQVDKPNLKVLGNVSVIVLGIIVASYGEIAFVFTGFAFQAFGICFESVRLVMVQKLLSSPEYKMDPLVSLYYFAPICAVMNGICCLIFEGPSLSVQAILDAGLVMLFMNAAVAFCLNVAVVFLVSLSLNLINVDRQNLVPRPHLIRRPKRYPPRRAFGHHLVDSCHRPTNVWLHHRTQRVNLVQDRWRTSSSRLHETHQ